MLQAELGQAVQVVQASMQAVSPQAALWVLLVLADLQAELDQVEVTLQDPEDALVLVQAQVPEAVSPQAALVPLEDELALLVLADLQDELVQVDQDLEDELDLVQAQVSEAVPPQAALRVLVLADLQDELVQVDQDLEDELDLVQAQVSEAVPPQAALRVLVLADLQDELVQVDQDLEDELDLVQVQVSEAVPPQAALPVLVLADLQDELDQVEVVLQDLEDALVLVQAQVPEAVSPQAALVPLEDELALLVLADLQAELDQVEVVLQDIEDALVLVQAQVSKAVSPQAALVLLEDELALLVPVDLQAELDQVEVALQDLEDELVLVHAQVPEAVLPQAALVLLEDELAPWVLVLADLQAELDQVEVVLQDLEDALVLVQAQVPEAVSPKAALVPLEDEHALWVLVLADLQAELDQVEVVLQDLEDALVLVHEAQVSEAVSPQAALVLLEDELALLVLADLQAELDQVEVVLQDLEDALVLVHEAQVSEAVSPQAALVLLEDEHEAQVSPETALQVPVDPALLPSGFHHAACAAITSPSHVQFGSPAWPKPHQRSHHHRCHLVSQLVQLTPKMIDQLKLRYQPKRARVALVSGCIHISQHLKWVYKVGNNNFNKFNK